MKSWVSQNCRFQSEISSGNESDSGSERDISDSSDDDEPEISLVGSEMSKKEALKALHEFIDGHCCWGRRPAKNLEVKSVTSSTAYKVFKIMVLFKYKNT